MMPLALTEPTDNPPMPLPPKEAMHTRGEISRTHMTPVRIFPRGNHRIAGVFPKGRGMVAVLTVG